MNHEIDQLCVRWRLADGVVTAEVLFGQDVASMPSEVASDLERGLGVHLGPGQRLGQLTAQQKVPRPAATAVGRGPS